MCELVAAVSPLAEAEVSTITTAPITGRATSRVPPKSRAEKVPLMVERRRGSRSI
jgi:hypothetical protein